MTAPLSPVPGPKSTDKDGTLTPLWQSWFSQLYTFLTQPSAGGGGVVPATRAINTTIPLSGGGNLTVDRTLSILTNGITNALLAQMAGNSLKGNPTGGVANAQDLTTAQVTALLNIFTNVLQGLVPSSGGGTNNLLRSDATWAAAVGASFAAGTFLKTGAVTVATLPAAATAGQGARYLVTDALGPAFGAAVVGGGAVIVPVYSTGAAWNVG